MNVLFLCADIDYVKLMDEKTPPKDILAPYLTSTNINNIMKLAAKIPDKVSSSFLYCLHLCIHAFSYNWASVCSWTLLCSKWLVELILLVIQLQCLHMSDCSPVPSSWGEWSLASIICASLFRQSVQFVIILYWQMVSLLAPVYCEIISAWSWPWWLFTFLF